MSEDEIAAALTMLDLSRCPVQHTQIPMPPAQPMPYVYNGDQPDFRNPPGTSGNDLHLSVDYLVPHKKQKMDGDKFDNPWSQPSTAAGSSGSFNPTASSSSTLSGMNQKMATDGVASSSQRASTPNTSSNSAQKRPALGASTGTPNGMNNAAADLYLWNLMQACGARMMENPCPVYPCCPMYPVVGPNFVPQLAAPNASGQQQQPLPQQPQLPQAQQPQMMPNLVPTPYGYQYGPGLPNFPMLGWWNPVMQQHFQQFLQEQSKK
uniref:Protein muscleblind n=1 Tax=Steinernema glaseri TaxID=37863 RepID=A0A1I7YJX0_9BILA